jgi:hypothetical protein
MGRGRGELVVTQRGGMLYGPSRRSVSTSSHSHLQIRYLEDAQEICRQLQRAVDEEDAVRAELLATALLDWDSDAHNPVEMLLTAVAGRSVTNIRDWRSYDSHVTARLTAHETLSGCALNHVISVEAFVREALKLIAVATVLQSAAQNGWANLSSFHVTSKYARFVAQRELVDSMRTVGDAEAEAHLAGKLLRQERLLRDRAVGPGMRQLDMNDCKMIAHGIFSEIVADRSPYQTLSTVQNLIRALR